MSGNDQEEEPMDTSDNQPPPASHDQCAENKEEVQVTLSVERPEGFHQQKCEIELEKVLQSWVNNKNNKYHGDCKVLSLSEDGSAVISLKPAPALSELQKLSGQQLTGRDRKTVKIMSVSLTPPEVKTPKEAPEGASVKLPPSSESEQDNEKVHPMVQRSAVSAAGEEHRTCSVHHFWYVNHIYKEEIKRIEKENGVKIMAEVNVTFQGEQKDGDPQKALSEFTNLVQQCLGESHGSVIPLKGVNPEEWKDTVNIIQSKDNKLLLTVSSEEMTVCGPRQSQDAIRKSLTATTNTSTSFGESTWPSQDTPPNIGMSIQDPLVNAGLTMEERYWKLMTTSDKEVAKIKTKFGVDFKESRTSQGKVEVKACYKKSGGKASMESHAVRALLHLYQKIATSPVNFTQQRGAIGLTDLQSEGASGGPGLNGQPGYNTEAATGGGATAGDSAEDEDCPICMDKFTNKTQLKCKHEFCEECLAKARESMGGDICPVCKDVFGLIEGDQPDGNMTNYDSPSSLPGFPGCGSIIINYDIQGGMQTEKHSNPGKYYSGISRTAYLPNNKEGREVLVLLKKAFKQKLIFTVGTSRTSGMDNQVTWNDIHHKTSTTGGPQSFGYPDPGYLSRVKDELKAKGVE